MKKYLMTGVAALAMCAAFTSCSKDSVEYDPANATQLKYEQAFNSYMSAIGVSQINPEQDWGFGTAGINYTRSITRGANTESKFWGDTYVIPEVIGSAERAKVIAEFSKVHTDLGEQPNFTNFFVQQVYKGTNTYPTFPNTDGIKSELNLGNTPKMDQLVCGPNNDHVNNFNCVSYSGGADNIEVWDGIHYRTDVTFSENDKQNFKQMHSDQIMLMEGSSTSRFGYLNSLDSKYHYEYIILKIDGAYYVGFDFCASKSFTEDGDPGEACAADHGTPISGTEIHYNDDGTIKGYESFDKDVHRDHIYNDWIVKITEADNKTNHPIYNPDNVRIIVEDLNANSPSDFDFNDVVFDVTYTSETSAQVTIKAAGGIYPLTVAGHEVHAELGYGTPDENGRYLKINTGASDGVDGAVAQPFTVSVNKSLRGADIVVQVDKGEGYITITSTKGHAAAKICVGQTFEWCSEKQRIDSKYKNFANWVEHREPLVWW